MSGFIMAKPIWLSGKDREMNIHAGFQTTINYIQGQYLLKISGATFYKIFVNGEFIHFGPAKAAHGYVRMDTIDLSNFLINGRNSVAIEVAGYYFPSYNGVKMPSFLQAEILRGGSIIAYTAVDGHFQGVQLTIHEQRVCRYSAARHFSEVYQLDHDDALTNWMQENAAMPIHEISEKDASNKYLDREAPYPSYDRALPTGIFCVRKALRKSKPASTREESDLKWVYDLAAMDIGRGISAENVRVRPVEVHDTYEFPISLSEEQVIEPSRCYDIAGGEFLAYCMGHIVVGFISAKITVREDSVVYILFDEKIMNGRLTSEAHCLNVIKYTLKKSDRPYLLMSFEPYGLMYGAVFAESGSILLEDFSVVEYAHPDTRKCSFHSSDTELNLIFDAAARSFRHNTLDIFMDCATRERAGWLCDSYFTARGEQLWGLDNRVERAFMENYRLYPGTSEIPPGMLPMCYPADHLDLCFIPQWAMWYIIQLGGYLRRDPDSDASTFKKTCYDLLAFLRQYANGDGLLENLPGWNFVEWSDANKWVKDVNYPTNMLYSKVLSICGVLFGDEPLITQALNIKSTIIEQAFDGAFFYDNAVRDDHGRLRLAGNRSEVCQYYAFYFGIADGNDARFIKLKETLLTVFGPERERNGVMPEIAYANAFMGNYMRMELFLEWGYHERMLDEIKSYFFPMAKATGTLWEMMKTTDSLDHGFASFIGVLIAKALSGIMDIDERNRRITVRTEDIPVSAEIVIPLRHGSARCHREIRDGKQVLEIDIPEEYSVIHADGGGMARRER